MVEAVAASVADHVEHRPCRAVGLLGPPPDGVDEVALAVGHDGVEHGPTPAAAEERAEA